jgi:flagellar protein FlaF
VYTSDYGADAYGSVRAPVRTDRGTEYEVVSRVTRRLAAASETRANSFAAFAAALHDNLRLWTAFAADVSDDGNALPAPLRGRIFYLAEFTRNHTQRALRQGADAQVLIDINTAILRGLRGKGETG